jgi:hypothetical protein
MNLHQLTLNEIQIESKFNESKTVCEVYYSLFWG